LKKSSSGGNLLSECGTPSPLTNELNFKALSAVDATFSSNIKYGCKTDTIIYTHNGFNDVNIWRWHLDNGITSTNKDTTVVYSDLNTKKVALYVSNGICSDSTATIIPLKNKGDTVNAGFTLSKQSPGGETTADLICPEEAILFRNNSMGVIQSWLWTFGDNQTSTAQNPPAKRYKPVKNAITYAIKLLVKGNYCTDTASQYLTVIPNCYIAVPTAFSPNDDGLNDYLYPLNAYKADNLIFKVYNRFGQLVFETNNWQVQWNGKVKGKQQSAGTYAWILQYTDRDSGQRIDEKGTTVLIR
jgi:gliding motility-associated-like protein